MAKRSLFSILSEQPWWVSLLVAAIVFAVAQFLLPQMALFIALPFAAVAAYVAHKQLRRSSPVNVDERLAALRGMSWENFGGIIEEAYRRQSYTVEGSQSAAFDFTLRKKDRITLVQCRRWKVNQVGVGPLRELYDAVAMHDAFDAVCIGTGAFSDRAREFAAGKRITLLNGSALVELVGTLEKRKWRWLPL